MFAKIASFEFRYQLRQPAFWVIAIVFGLLAFGAVASPNVQIGSGGIVNKNAPFALASAHIIFNVFFMLATTAIVANVVARDTQTGFGPMIPPHGSPRAPISTAASSAHSPRWRSAT